MKSGMEMDYKCIYNFICEKLQTWQWNETVRLHYTAFTYSRVHISDG